jgi:PadR family transcriptional regulator PadR
MKPSWTRNSSPQGRRRAGVPLKDLLRDADDVPLTVPLTRSILRMRTRSCERTAGAGKLNLCRLIGVVRSRRPSAQTLGVLRALLADPGAWRYGYELAAEVGLRSGSLYPILVRLSDRELLEARWEAATRTGRPPRHLYRLTADGVDYATAHAAAASPIRLQPRSSFQLGGG